MAQGISVPTYRNTTFREGILKTFAVGTTPSGRASSRAVTRSTCRTRTARRAVERVRDGVVRRRLPGRRRSRSTTIRVRRRGAATELVGDAERTVAVAFYDRRLPCPSAGTAEATTAGLSFDPNARHTARSDYCVNTAIQFYEPALTPLGPNLRLSPHTWDPQLSAPHPSASATRRRSSATTSESTRPARDLHDLRLHLQRRHESVELPAADRRRDPDAVAAPAMLLAQVGVIATWARSVAATAPEPTLRQRACRCTDGSDSMGLRRGGTCRSSSASVRARPAIGGSISGSGRVCGSGCTSACLPGCVLLVSSGFATGPSPVDRARTGSKHHLRVDRLESHSPGRERRQPSRRHPADPVARSGSARARPSRPPAPAAAAIER